MRTGRSKTVALLLIGTLVMALPTYAQGDQSYPKEKIEQLVAPIALYPDGLLSQVLMASTYPLELVEADRWVKANPSLKGKALDDALAKQAWDPSVISLCQLPDVLSRMSQNLDWTQDLGNAFLAQQADVMTAVQKLRNDAYKAGNLKSSEQTKVVVEKETIVIQPANPQVVYVPAYDPTVVYGYPPPPSYYYPAVMAPPPGYALARGIAWGVGFAIGSSIYGGCNWGGNNVYINNTTINNNNIYKNTNVNKNYNKNTNINNKNQNWNHNPEHRGNVNYGNQQMNQKYNKSGQGGISKDAARGYDRPGQGGSGTRDVTRPGQGGSGTRQPDRATTGQKQSAMGGYGNGSFEKQASSRGAQSRNKPNSGMSKSYGGGQKGGGASKSGGGGRSSSGGRSSGGGGKRR